MKTLLVPAVAIGNVGQIALDCIAAKLAPEAGPGVVVEHLDNAGFLQSCIGLQSDDTTTSNWSTSLELITLNDSLSLLQIRSPVLPGKSRLFAKHVLNLAHERGFQHIVVLGGASALALTHERDFYETRNVPRLYRSSTTAEESKDLRSTRRMLASEVAQLRLAGLAPFFVTEAEANKQELSVLIRLVFEGENELDGAELARQALEYVL